MHKYRRNLLPLIFHNTCIHNSSIHSYPKRHSNYYHLENPTLVLAQRSVKHHGPDIWNSLPDQIISLTSLRSFKANLKSLLLSKYQHPHANVPWIIQTLAGYIHQRAIVHTHTYVHTNNTKHWQYFYYQQCQHAYCTFCTCTSTSCTHLLYTPHVHPPPPFCLYMFLFI